VLPQDDGPTGGEKGSRQVEEDDARREQTSPSLEQFRGGDNLEALSWGGLLVLAGLVTLLYFGIAALEKATTRAPATSR
jgi:hypothetical protein